MHKLNQVKVAYQGNSIGKKAGPELKPGQQTHRVKMTAIFCLGSRWRLSFLPSIRARLHSLPQLVTEGKRRLRKYEAWLD